MTETALDLIARFDAIKGLQYPKIKIEETDFTAKLTVYRSGQNSREPGSLQIVDGERDGQWYGVIKRDGSIFWRDAPNKVKATVLALIENPAGFARVYGQRSGNCCFCARELTDPRSLAMGYGPVCAGHYNLPWGEVEAEPDFEPFDNPEGLETATIKAENIGHTNAAIALWEEIESLKNRPAKRTSARDIAYFRVMEILHEHNPDQAAILAPKIKEALRFM